MRKKKILLVLVVILALVVLCIALFSETASSSGDGNMQAVEDQPSDTFIAESQSSDSLFAESQSSEASAVQSLSAVYENGMFTFNTGQFCEQFADTLPDGYTFADAIVAHPTRNNKLQIDILDATENSTDIAILMNTQETNIAYSQMALVMKYDCYEEDAAAILQWYIATFLTGFNEEEQTMILEDCLDMFSGSFSNSEEYRLHTAEQHDVIMVRKTEDTGKYYYVLISLQ